ncbi:MAG: DAHL domain-containing protein, partial [Burkholderiales bacterium]
MNLRQVLPVLLAGLAIGVLVFLIVKTQSVNSDLHQERLALIRKIDSLDVKFNRAYTQGRYTSLMEGTDERTKITQELGDTLNKIDKGPQALRGLSPAVDKALDTFLDTIDNKLELGFDFEARNVLNNQRLIQTMDAV